MIPAPRRPTPAQLAALARRDRALGRAVRRYGPYPGFPDPGLKRRETHFGALGRAILFQQLAGAAASTIHRRVCALTPGRGFPRPQQILDLSAARLREAGVSQPKQRSLRDLAQYVTDGRLRLPSLGRRPDEEVIEALVQVRGIGRWSAQMFLMSRLGRLDVMAEADLGLAEGLRRLDGLKQRPSHAQLAQRAQVWAPLRSVAAWTLWRLAEDPDLA